MFRIWKKIFQTFSSVHTIIASEVRIQCYISMCKHLSVQVIQQQFKFDSIIVLRK